MPSWVPEKVWDNQEVYIIGGGKSLEHFDWNLLKDKFVIGCNDAYKLGSFICDICVFGDAKWFDFHKQELVHYKGTVFTNNSRLHKKSPVTWLWTMRREGSGLHLDALGWNFSTGALAVNLALLLGAKKIYLLGFDMKLSKDGDNNWHPNKLDKPNKTLFPKFVKGFLRVKADLEKKFADVEVFNITDDSDLNVFPKIGVKEFWSTK
jgi:uncharacterized Rossmann fold enzyme